MDAEVIGFDAGQVIAVPLWTLTGVGPDEVVRTTGAPLQVGAGKELLGRVVDGLGRALDGRCLPSGLRPAWVDRSAPPALSRSAISRPFVTGVRAIDGLLTLGVGQRIGLFSGSGVGKSTLLGSLARNAQADAVVVTTSDAPALERLRAAQTATALAEAMRDQGANVLLLVDSVTRFARAQREVGLAAGEPPARRGFPPSVFAALPRLLERAGTASVGSITAVYTVLVEGDDLDEPIADEVRGIVDGHVILDRDLASQGHYPAIDVVKSISRVMPRVVTPQQLTWSRQLRALVSAYEQKRDLIVLGGYVKGTDASVDRAIRARDQIEAYLRQGSDERTGFEDTWAKIEYLVSASYR